MPRSSHVRGVVRWSELSIQLERFRVQLRSLPTFAQTKVRASDTPACRFGCLNARFESGLVSHKAQLEELPIV